MASGVPYTAKSAAYPAPRPVAAPQAWFRVPAGSTPLTVSTRHLGTVPDLVEHCCSCKRKPRMKNRPRALPAVRECDCRNKKTDFASEQNSSEQNASMHGGKVGVPQVATALPPGVRVVRTSQPAVVPAGAPVNPASASRQGIGQTRSVRPNTVGGPAYSQSAYETKHEKDAQLQNLKELRKTCGLKEIPVHDGLQAFKSAATTQDKEQEQTTKLTRDKFLGAYAQLLTDHKVDVPKDEVKHAVFDLFDRDDNNIVAARSDSLKISRQPPMTPADAYLSVSKDSVKHTLQ
ncbi:FRQ1 [Symbiodinium natans]|uniref:FRQ1 protein n=1 Tax=Symbiodinium natans TaxID=878477 RepID=A0A812I986_9DINO|nr:FRQ1 [Symbiodinium natans]